MIAQTASRPSRERPPLRSTAGAPRRRPGRPLPGPEKRSSERFPLRPDRHSDLRVRADPGQLAGQVEGRLEAADLVDEPELAGLPPRPDPAAADLVHFGSAVICRPSAAWVRKRS